MRPVLSLLLLLIACKTTEPDTGPDTDCAEPTTWYFDADDDGFGSDLNPVLACSSPGVGYSETGGDCDDATRLAFPGALERCLDGADLNCDGDVGCTLGPADLWGFSDAPESGWFGGPSHAGDTDGDGTIDLALGAPQSADNAGRVSLLDGDWTVRRSVVDTPERSVDGAPGERLGEAVLAVPGLLGAGMALAVRSNSDAGKAVHVYTTPLSDVSTPSVSLDFAGAAAALSLAAGDMDDDGVIELILPDGEGRIVGYEAPLAGSLETPAWSIDVPAHQGVGQILVVQDLDVDGDDDLLVLADRDEGAPFDQALYLFRGPLGAATTVDDADLVLSDDGDVVRIWGVAAGDVDGDGDLELAVAWTSGAQRLAILQDLSDGSALLSARAWAVSESEEVRYAGVALGGAGGRSGGRSVVAGSPQYGDDTVGRRGRVDVFVDLVEGTFTPDDAAITVLGDVADQQIGSALMSVGDLDDDGQPETWFRASAAAGLGGILLPGDR